MLSCPGDLHGTDSDSIEIDEWIAKSMKYHGQLFGCANFHLSIDLHALGGRFSLLKQCK